MPEGVPSFDPQDYYEGRDKEGLKVLNILKHLADKVGGAGWINTRSTLKIVF